MREPLMPPGEAAAYAAVLLIAVASIPLTLHLFPTGSIIWRLVSLIPSGLLVAVATAMTVGIVSALEHRAPDD
jgi:hypothetical protein